MRPCRHSAPRRHSCGSRNPSVCRLAEGVAPPSCGPAVMRPPSSFLRKQESRRLPAGRGRGLAVMWLSAVMWPCRHASLPSCAPRRHSCGSRNPSVCRLAEGVAPPSCSRPLSCGPAVMRPPSSFLRKQESRRLPAGRGRGPAVMWPRRHAPLPSFLRKQESRRLPAGRGRGPAIMRPPPSFLRTQESSPSFPPPIPCPTRRPTRASRNPTTRNLGQP